MIDQCHNEAAILGTVSSIVKYEDRDFVQMQISTIRRWESSKGYIEEREDIFSVVGYGSSARSCKKCLIPGQKVFLTGRMEESAGTVRIVIQKIIFLSKPKPKYSQETSMYGNL